MNYANLEKLNMGGGRHMGKNTASLATLLKPDILYTTTQETYENLYKTKNS